jgi:hypothetical protein
MQAEFEDGLEVIHSLKSLQFRPSVAMPNFERVIVPRLLMQFWERRLQSAASGDNIRLPAEAGVPANGAEAVINYRPRTFFLRRCFQS